MFGFFESDETKRLKSHIKNLGALAKVDGHVDPDEMNYIVAIGTRHGLKAHDVKQILSNLDRIEVKPPANDTERFDQIYDLVEMMLADGIIDEKEMEFCTSMALKLGFRKSIVGVLVRKISIGVKDGMPREMIREEAQAFFY
ncbi:tellurite resistance TerB family protein [Pontibacter beigongshangensis]|uniref:tellurite resistance TerB family protein n=1 Tax=Pontibacter beigongshangensis TaxID=2574733 RepID=UPI00164FE26E|nr:TerB family tellurite resistance protein [Pontibacter beigongshangensis]